MAWMSMNETCAALGISQRTLSTRIRKGDLRTRKEGRRVFVDVVGIDATTTADVASVGGSLASIVASNAIKNHDNAEAMNAMVLQHSEHIGDLRKAVVATESRATSLRRANWTLAAAVGLMAFLVLAGGYMFEGSEVEHLHQLQIMDSSVQIQEARCQQLERTADIRSKDLQAATVEINRQGDVMREQRDEIIRLESQSVGAWLAKMFPTAKPLKVAGR